LLDALQEIVAALLTTPPEALLQLIVDQACDLINAPAGSIWTAAEPDWLILRQVVSGHHWVERWPLLPGQAEPLARLRQPITIDDVRLQPDLPYQNRATERGWVSAIVVPLLIPAGPPRLVGAISLYAAELRDFSDWDKKLLTCLANHAAVAIRGAEQLAQLKLAQERQAMAETFAAVGDVAANLMHQLNNKVGVIPPLVQGIEDKYEELLAGFPSLTAQLQEIEQSARKAIDIVRSSMAHLRPPERRPVEVGRCLERAVQQAAPLPGVTLIYEGLAGLPRVVAGEQQLEMVFYNLIDNALTALAGQGQLRLTGARQGYEVAITIADTGPGIPPELKPHLFEFSPAKAAAADQPARRLGFGLWWVKTFVERFGGHLDFKSIPGQGSAFTVYLPAEE
jgi:signal transduction histidine kinase